jgi:hypothetical protein
MGAPRVGERVVQDNALKPQGARSRLALKWVDLNLIVKM